jgi:catechol O-methyltransferase
MMIFLSIWLWNNYKQNFNNDQFADGREQALHDHIFSLPQEPLRNNPQAVCTAIDEYIKTHWMMTFPPSKIAIAEEILKAQTPAPKILVELGCYVGSSAVAWGALIKELNVGDISGCKVYTCELDEGIAKIAQDIIDLAGLNDIVEIIVGKSTDSIKMLKAEGKIDHIDVLFIDHWEEFYLPDLMVCEDEGLLKKGAVVLADNVDMPGAPKYLEYVQKGGRGAEGGVKLETKSYWTEDEGRVPKQVEVTKVLG